MEAAPPASPVELFDVRGRTAIVTGASSGLGARFAKVLHHCGAQVALAARRTDRLEKLSAELPGSIVVGCDVTNEEERYSLLARTESELGPLDILVNNAGVMTRGPTAAEPVESFEATLAVNLTATFRLAQLAAVTMIERGHGSIINLTSVLGLVASDSIPYPAYAASKAAVIHLTRELGAEWASHGVRCNAIAPGWFHSEITEEFLEDERAMRAILRKTPMARIGNGHELDGVLLFLSSDASSFMTGQTIVIDGGLTLI